MKNVLNANTRPAQIVQETTTIILKMTLYVGAANTLCQRSGKTDFTKLGATGAFSIALFKAGKARK